MPTCIAMVWRKSWISVGSTFIVELENAQLSLIYAGHAMADCQIRVGRTNLDPTNRISIERGTGQLVANAMVKKYTKTLNKNVEAYNNGERDHLAAHKKSQSFNLSDVGNVEVVDKPASSDPMAVKAHDTGLIQFTASGKRWRMAIRNSTKEEVQKWATLLE